MTAFMTGYLLGIDVGTMATKAILAEPGGRVLAQASSSATLRSPRPGWAEEDAEEWWDNVGTVCRELLARTDISGGRIAAVGVS